MGTDETAGAAMKEKNNGRWRDAKYLLSLLLVLLVMGLIFFFSAQPLKQSTGASGVCVDGLIRVSVPEYGGMSADSQQRLWQRLSFLARKAAHLLEYAALGFSLLLHLNELRRWRPVPRAWLWAWGIAVLYAATDELHQFFVEGRGPRLSDVGIDSLGAILGILLMLLILRLLRRRREKRAV